MTFINVLVGIIATSVFIGGVIGWYLRGRDNKALAGGDVHCSRDDVEKRARRAF